MIEWTSSALFGILLCIFTYEIGLWINKKAKTPLANPLIISVILVIAILQIFGIPLDNFQKGGDFINMFLAPATAALALSVYSQWELLKKNWIPVVGGALVGSAVSLGSIYGMSKLFGLDDVITASLLPKSVTTPIAMELSTEAGGIAPLTVAAVMISGIGGAMFMPFLIKLFRLDNPVAQGVASGTASHAIGTSKALQLGETQGAMSGISIGVAGILTVVLHLIFFS